MALLKPSTWPVTTTMVVIPIIIITTYGAAIVAQVYFDSEGSTGGIEFSRCILTLSCSSSELGPYSLMGGMLFAISWTIAYAIHFSFPSQTRLLLFGTILAAPFYSFGIFGTSSMLRTETAADNELSLFTLAFLGLFGSAFHIFGLALGLRLMKAVFNYRKSRSN